MTTEIQLQNQEEILKRPDLYNIEAEQIILGSIIINNEYIHRISEFLLPEHLFEPAHKKIYQQILHNVNKVNIIANEITLKQFFDNNETLASFGGSLYLSTLLSKATGIIDIYDYAHLIHDLALKRELVIIGEDVVNNTYKDGENTTAQEQIEQAEANLFQLAHQGSNNNDFKNISHSLKETLERTLIAKQREGNISGVSTGLDDLDKILGGMQNSDLIILAGRPSMGKAQPLDAKVLTNIGFRRMGDLEIGDELASIDGKKSQVTDIFPQGKKEIYEINFDDGRSTQCCLEHLWQVNNRKWKNSKVLNTKELIELIKKPSYKNRIFIENFSGKYGNSNNSNLDPWLLGVLIGDGTLSGSSVRFSNIDQNILKKVQDKIGNEFLLKKISNDNNCDYRIIQANGSHKKGVIGVLPSQIKESLKLLDLWDIKSENKFIPQNYLESNIEDRISLLCGLIDSDGWVEKWGTLRFASSSIKLANDVVNLVRSIGGIASINKKSSFYINNSGQKVAGQDSYVINICNINYKISNFLASQKKQERLINNKKQKRSNIVNIKKIGVKEARCISVSHESKLYITDDYIVTHNTALAINVAVNACKALNNEEQNKEDKKSVGFFSLEMSADQLSARILSMETSISATKFRTGEIDEEEWQALTQRSVEIADMPFFIDDTPALSIAAIRTRTRRLLRKHNLGFLLIDYLQLIRGSSKASQQNRVQEISEITQGLKAIAKEFNIPVIALSQLSRAVEQRDDKRPQLSDLRESGSIEQDADVVAFIYRESYYEERKRPGEEEADKFTLWQEKMSKIRNVSEVIIAKQRNGPIGSISLYFDPEFTRFNNLDLNH